MPSSTTWTTKSLTAGRRSTETSTSAETENSVQFTRQALKQLHYSQRWLDRSEKHQQNAGDGILLGNFGISKMHTYVPTAEFLTGHHSEKAFLP